MILIAFFVDVGLVLRNISVKIETTKKSIEKIIIANASTSLLKI